MDWNFKKNKNTEIKFKDFRGFEGFVLSYDYAELVEGRFSYSSEKYFPRVKYFTEHNYFYFEQIFIYTRFTAQKL